MRNQLAYLVVLNFGNTNGLVKKKKIRTLPFDISGDPVFVALAAVVTFLCCGVVDSGGPVSNNLCEINLHT